MTEISKRREAIFPGVYAKLTAIIAETAERLGYAIAVHGSLHRDLDLVAVPWIENAVEPRELVEAVRASVGGVVLPDGSPAARWDQATQKFVETPLRNPEYRPHGRQAWAINLGGGAYLDLSITPKS